MAVTQIINIRGTALSPGLTPPKIGNIYGLVSCQLSQLRAKGEKEDRGPTYN
jgi:hypothetical protein